MYEEKEKKIDWGNIIKKVVTCIAVILIILGIITLVGKCSKNNDNKNKEENTKVNLNSQLDEFEEAILKYLNKDNLPTELGASKTIRLKIVQNKGLIGNLKDSKNNRCDSNESYAEVTRLDDNYAVKTTLVCGGNTDYRVTYVGCFPECNGEVCTGSEDSKNGICNVKPVEETPSNTETNKTETTTNTSKPSTVTPAKKPTTNNKKPSNNTTTNNKPETITLYEHKKCETTSYTCKNIGGTLVYNSVCEKTTPRTAYGKVVKSGGQTVSKTEYIPANVGYRQVESAVKYFSTTAKGKAAGYTHYVGYTPGKGYGFTKMITESYYYCTTGTRTGSNCAVKKSSTTPVKYSCADSSYKFNSNTKQCTKVVYDVTRKPAEPVTTCRTTWSRSTSLAGWTRTGNTKTE